MNYDVKKISSIGELEALYKRPVAAAAREKVYSQITPLYRTWIEASRFLVLTTVGPEGTDGSPRGDAGPVIRISNPKTLLLPDWRGNNRLDSLRNIVLDGRVSLMFMVPGCSNVVRVNGRATLTADSGLRKTFEVNGKTPATLAIITIEELYFQCAKAIIRSRIWSDDSVSENLPTAGDFIREFKKDFDSKNYDESYGEYAKERLW